MIDYKTYHYDSLKAGDVDPSITALKYISNRFELNIEQRYWLSFLYGTCYCAPTTFYMYNEFPDYINTDFNRLKKWWYEKKDKLIFQTDRMRIKSNNQFLDSFISYRKLVGNNQQKYFKSKSWTEMYSKISGIKYFGRFSLFNYLDVLNSITDVNLRPPYLNMLEAESCRNGVCYSIDRLDLVDKKSLTKVDLELLHNKFLYYLKNYEGNVFQIETTLCAYKKYRKGKRYIGFYIDRMYNEIKKIEQNVPDGICWDVLWEFREETFNIKNLIEKR